MLGSKCTENLFSEYFNIETVFLESLLHLVIEFKLLEIYISFHPPIKFFKKNSLLPLVSFFLFLESKSCKNFGWQVEALEVRGRWWCCVWEKPPVGAVLGHVAQRNGAVFHPDPSMRKKEKRRPRGGCTAGQEKGSFTGGKSWLLKLLNMESRLVCGISGAVGEQWVFSRHGFDFHFVPRAVCVVKHICNDAGCGPEQDRRDFTLPFRIPFLQSCDQNITGGHGYTR